MHSSKVVSTVLVLNHAILLNQCLRVLSGSLIGSAALIHSKFSNSQKSIEFEDVYLNDVFEQIDKLYLD